MNAWQSQTPGCLDPRRQSSGVYGPQMSKHRGVSAADLNRGISGVLVARHKCHNSSVIGAEMSEVTRNWGAAIMSEAVLRRSCGWSQGTDDPHPATAVKSEAVGQPHSQRLHRKHLRTCVVHPKVQQAPALPNACALADRPSACLSHWRTCHHYPLTPTSGWTVHVISKNSLPSEP